MSNHCPICKTPTLEAARLANNLEADVCTSCRGSWITSARYFGYLNEAGEKTEDLVGFQPVESSAPPMPAADSPSMKLCPACGKFMRYYPIGHGIAFGIDKCGTCGGVWLNHSEWDALVARKLHTKLHAVTSDAWQESVRKQLRAATERAALLRRLGEQDLAELDRITQWNEHHPERAVRLSHQHQRMREG